MGHNVTGIVAENSVLESFASKHSLHPPIPLNAGLAILPLRDDDIDSFLAPPLTGHADGFTYLSEQLVRVLAAASLHGNFLYFETEYCGGTGSQGAVVFRDGTVVYGPRTAGIGPISEALRLLGVTVVPPDFDEFETVGLRRFRHTEDWLEGHE